MSERPDECIRLLAYCVFWNGSNDMIVLTARNGFRWIPLRDVNRYDFAPADIPFIDMLVERV